MEKRAIYLFCGVFLAALVFIAAVYAVSQMEQADPAIEAGLLPHQAVYDISLVSRKPASSVVNISGRLTYSWYPSCESWSTHHSYELRYDNTDGSVQEIDSSYTTDEAKDGSYLKFSSERRTFGEVIEAYEGVAEQTEDGTYRAVYTVPEASEKPLPPGTMFPIAHTLAVIEALKNRASPIFYAKIFDGSDAEGAVAVNTVIGRQDEGYIPLDAKLQPDVPYRLRLAFFTESQDNPEEAGYEMDVVLHANGVIADMKIEYPEFAIRQTLVEIAPLEARCEEK